MTGLDREEADRALERLTGESDRVAEALVAMDGHPGHQLLRGATLSGLTQRQWAEASTAMTTLWEQFDAYRGLLDRAKAVRARKVRPGPAELDELTELLTGPVVELSQEQVPIERRSLTGKASASELVSLAELVARMKTGYTQVTEVLAEADAAWSAVVRRLDPVAEELRGVTALVESVGSDDQPVAVDRIRVRLTEIRRTALSDPLGAGADDQLRELHAELTTMRSRLDALASARDSFHERVARLDAVLTDLADTQTESRKANAEVLAKIAAPGLGEIVDAVPPLRKRVDALPALRRAADWRRLSTELDQLDRAANGALDEARTQLRTIVGLLDRRAELRGRLEAYRAKAARRGRAEDLSLNTLHGQAHDLLFTAPCDLAAATRAVNRYQQAVAQEGSR